MVKAGKWGLCIVALIVLVGVAVALLVQELSCPAVGSDPADIEGVWHHSALNCLEGGPNILVFEGGKCFNYSSIHKTYELVGGYERLPGGKYKLTGNILLKSSSEAGKWFKEIYEKRKSEFPNVTIHPNGDITDIMTTILEPTR